jgi:hypothetical protein
VPKADASAILQVKVWLTSISPWYGGAFWCRQHARFANSMAYDLNIPWRHEMPIQDRLEADTRKWPVDRGGQGADGCCPTARAAQEFSVYIASNTGSLINYGERFRAGEWISSCLAESTVIAMISKRLRQTSADALDEARRVADPNPGARWHAPAPLIWEAALQEIEP